MEIAMKKILPAAITALALLAVGVVVQNYMEVHKSYVPPSDEIGTGYSVVIDPFVVNLADTTGSRFLRLEMTLDVPTELQATVLETEPIHMMRLRNAILAILSAEKAEPLTHESGKLALKQKIAAVANEHGKGPLTADNVHFAALIVQF